MPVVPTTAIRSATTADAVSEPARARPLERDLANRVALEHHRVERALDRGERVVPVDESRANPHVDLPVDERGRPDEPDDHLHLARGGNVCGLDGSMPWQATSSGVTREPNATVARIAIFAAASAPETSSVGSASANPSRCASASASLYDRAALHLGEHEVRRPVDDPEHAVDVRDDERLPQHLDHGNRRADRGLEPELDAAVGSGGEELRSPRRATSCLFAVTTGFPARKSSST